MTTWTKTSNMAWDNSDHTRPFFSHTSGGTGDLISPYGDFNASTDITKFWDTSLDSVTTEYLESVTIDSGGLKILGDSTSNYHRYIKAISVNIGETYTISGDSIAGSATTSIWGGSTSKGQDYFIVLADAFPDDWEDDVFSGLLTFTATTDTFYLTFSMTDVSSYYITGDNISLIGPIPRSAPTATWKSTELMQYGFATWSGIGYNWEASLSAFVNSPTTQHDESSGKWEDLE